MFKKNLLGLGQAIVYFCRMSEIYSYSALHSFARDIFIKIGCSIDDATIAANSLLIADVRGVDSHGVARLSGYVRLWEAERINSKLRLEIVHETPSTAVVDGDGGLSMVLAPFAMQVA